MPEYSTQDVRLIRTSPVVYQPAVLLQEAKDALRVTHSEDDAMIEAQVIAASEWLEGIKGLTGRVFLAQEFEAIYQCWPACGYFVLPLNPVRSVSEIRYVDEDDNEATVAAGDYLVSAADREPCVVQLRRNASWPVPALRELDPIIIAFTAGYSDYDAVPEPIKQAILLMTNLLYDGHAMEESGPRALVVINNLIANYTAPNYY